MPGAMGAEKFCFHDAPNTNQENLDLEAQRPQWHKMLDVKDKLDLLLTNEQMDAPTNRGMGGRMHWHKLIVRDATTNNVVGSWTPIYNEGFELHAGGQRFFAFSSYKCSEPSDADFDKYQKEAAEGDGGSDDVIAAKFLHRLMMATH